jgi:hypothetical protein
MVPLLETHMIPAPCLFSAVLVPMGQSSSTPCGEPSKPARPWLTNTRVELRGQSKPKGLCRDCKRYATRNTTYKNEHGSGPWKPLISNCPLQPWFRHEWRAQAIARPSGENFPGDRPGCLTPGLRQSNLPSKRISNVADITRSRPWQVLVSMNLTTPLFLPPFPALVPARVAPSSSPPRGALSPAAAPG